MYVKGDFMKDRTIAEQLEKLKSDGKLDNLPKENVVEEKSQDVRKRIDGITYETINEDIDFFIQKSNEHIDGYKETDDLRKQAVQETLENVNLTEDEKKEEIERILTEYKPFVESKYQIPLEDMEEAAIKINKLLDKKVREIRQKQKSYNIEFEKGEERVYDRQKDDYVKVMVERNPEVIKAKEEFKKNKEIVESLEEKLENLKDPQQIKSCQEQIENAKTTMNDQKQVISEKFEYYKERRSTLDKMEQDVGKDIEEYNQKSKKFDEFENYSKNINIEYKSEINESKLYNYSKIKDYESKVIEEVDEPIVYDNQREGKKEEQKEEQEQEQKDNTKDDVSKDENQREDQSDGISKDDSTKNGDGKPQVNNSPSNPQKNAGTSPVINQNQQTTALTDPKKENKLKVLFRNLVSKIKNKFKTSNDYDDYIEKMAEMNNLKKSEYDSQEVLKDKQNLINELAKFKVNDREYAKNAIKNMDEEFKGFNLDDKLINDFKEHSKYIKRYENMSRAEILKENISKKIGTKSRNTNPEPGIEM